MGVLSHAFKKKKKRVIKVVLSKNEDMSPTHSICLANNKGGAGKTFMAYQLACEAARAKPDSKILVVDFSIYSDISALLMGGSSRDGFGRPMKGLQVAVDAVDPDERADALVRDLELAALRKKLRREDEEASSYG